MDKIMRTCYKMYGCVCSTAAGLLVIKSISIPDCQLQNSKL